MENIDDFMQRKFDSDDPAERFPFREEYWEQAQALIEAEEQRRRKRRRFLFWWFCCGLLIGAGGLWLWRDQPAPSTEMASDSGASRTGVASAVPHTDAKNLPADDRTSAKTNLQPLASLPTTGALHTDKNIDAAKNEVIESASHSVSNRTGKTEKNVVSKVPAHRSAKDNRLAGSGRKSDQTEIKNVSGNAASGNKISIPDHTTGQNATNPNVQTTVSGISMTNTATPEADSMQTSDPASKSVVALLEVLELPFPPASDRRKKLLLKKLPKQFAAEIKPVQDQRITIGAAIAISSWKAGAGYTAGAFASYPLSADWSLGAGLQLRYVPLATPDAEPDSSENVSVQYRYSFGYERTEFRRTTVGLHYVELPLAVRWQHGRLGIEAGVAPGVLLLAKDRITQTRESSLGGIEKLADRFESGDKARFRNSYFNTFAMVEWRAVSRLGLTLRGNYRPASLLKPVENVSPGKDAWGLDLGLRWRF